MRPWQLEQTTRLPPSPRDWLADDHQVIYRLDLVDALDLSGVLIPAQAKDPRSEEGFDLRMQAKPSAQRLTMLLLQACYEDLAFRMLTGNQQPDYSRNCFSSKRLRLRRSLRLQ